MKKCSQCNTVYENEVVYCLNDGTPLVGEAFSLPSDDYSEPETVIRREPIIVDFGAKQEIPPPNINYQVAPPAKNVVIVPAKPASSRNYLLFLLIGLLLGGGLVLAALLLPKIFNRNENTVSVKANQTEKPVKTTPTTENKNVSVLSQPISDKHDKPTAASDGDFNGRVIVPNARVRSSPSADASVVETIPINDRLNIIGRETPNSPWYEVECEHGTTGWMHGNTIEFTR